MAEASKLARTLAAQPPIAVRYILSAINKGPDMPFADACVFEATLFGLAASSEDMREGTRAFLEKRPARVQGEVGGAVVPPARMNTIDGARTAPNLRVALVVSKYNDFVTDRLQAGRSRRWRRRQVPRRGDYTRSRARRLRAAERRASRRRDAAGSTRSCAWAA